MIESITIAPRNTVHVGCHTPVKNHISKNAITANKYKDPEIALNT